VDGSEKTSRGFTLIELLIAVAIVGIVTGIGLRVLPSGQTKGRDAQRKQDLQNLKVSLELYFQENGSYPGVSGTSYPSSPSDPNWIPGMAPYTSLPVDPKQASTTSLFDRFAQLFKGPPPAVYASTVTTIDLNGGGSAAIYCLSSTDCKIVYSSPAGTTFFDCDNSPCSAGTKTIIDSTYTGSTYPSIFCPTTDDCKVAYMGLSGSSEVLKFRDCDNATCSTGTTITADSTAGSGYYSSIYCSTATNCKIAYDDGNAHTAKFKDCDDAVCSTGTITTLESTGASGSGGMGTGIYCPTSNDCKVTYFNSDTLYLKLRDCANESCSSSTVGNVDTTTNGYGAATITCPGGATDCKIAYTGSPDGTNVGLEFKDCDNATCSTGTITSLTTNPGDGYGRFILSCPTSDNCKIVHYDWTGKQIKFRDCDNATCSTGTNQILQSLQISYPSLSITCPSSNDCKITFYDSANTALKLIDCDEEVCSPPTTPTPTPTPPRPISILARLIME